VYYLYKGRPIDHGFNNLCHHGVVITGKVKERWAEHFENVLNRDTVAGKDIDENGKVCDTLDVKEDLFCEEELAAVLKALKIIRLHMLIVW